MTTLTRSAITGLYHPRRRLIDNQNLTTTSAVDRLLNADKSGFLPSDSSIDSSRSSSNPDLSNSSSLERSVLEAQVKRVHSCNETLEASIKRLRSESHYSIEDLTEKNESLERSLHESRIKISELEHLLDKTKQAMITSSDTKTPISTYQSQIKTLENDKLEMKLQLQQYQHLHTKEVTQLEKSINNSRHQLIETENKFQLSQLEQEKLTNLHSNTSHQLQEKTEQIEKLQKRIIELELILSTFHPTNTINQTLLDDIKHTNDLRYKNEELKKQIELLKLKCNERVLHEEEIRMLRQQVHIGDDYRMVIARKDAEILKLREQLANEYKKPVEQFLF